MFAASRVGGIVVGAQFGIRLAARGVDVLLDDYAIHILTPRTERMF